MKEKQYRAIIFDLDGTLIDNYASFWAAFDEFAAEFPTIFRSEDEIQRATWIDVYYRSNRRAASRKATRSRRCKRTRFSA